MARTVAEAVTQARYALNDDDGQRASTTELESYAREAVVFLRQERPDLFLANWGAIGALTGNASLPVDDAYFQPIADYMAARASIKDDEHVNNGRIELLAKLVEGFVR